MLSIPLSFVAAALAVLLGSAAPVSGISAEPATDMRGSPDRVAIFVHNQTGRSLTVAVERSDARTVLGRLHQGERRRFDLPAEIVAGSDMRLVATRPGEASRLESESLFAVKGDEISWQVKEAPASRNAVGWGILTNIAPRDAHRYSRRG